MVMLNYQCIEVELIEHFGVQTYYINKITAFPRSGRRRLDLSTSSDCSKQLSVAHFLSDYNKLPSQ